MAKKFTDLFKPKWQHSNTRTRAWAVANMNEPKLLEAMQEIAANDQESSVRLEAAKRIDDFDFIRKLSENDESEDVRSYAKRWIRSLLIETKSPQLSLDQGIDYITSSKDLALIEHLAHHAKETQLRGAAQSCIKRQGMLGDIVLNDSSAELRKAALERITQQSTLERIQKASRRNDKQLYRIATAKLAENEPEQKTDNQHSLAQSLCEQTETLMRSSVSKTEKESELKHLTDQWEAIPEDSKQDLQKRFQGACNIIQRILKPETQQSEPLNAEQRAISVELNGLRSESVGIGINPELRLIQGLIDRSDSLKSAVEKHLDVAAASQLEQIRSRLSERRDKILDEQPVSPELLKLCERIEKIPEHKAKDRQIEQLDQQWQQQWKRLGHYSANDQAIQQRFQAALDKRKTILQEQQQKREQALEKVEDAITALETSTESGDLSVAAKAQGKLLDLLKAIGSHPQVNQIDFKARLNTARGKLNELRDWQHWSNNKIRDRLCEQAEAIPGSGMHPDAVAEKIKTLRNRWNALNDSEKLPGDKHDRRPAPGLYRRFQSACNLAFKPAKGFFEKRDQVRKTHLDELVAIAEQTEAVAQDHNNKDIRQMEKQIRESRKALRELNQIPPRERGPMSKRLRDGAQTLDQLLEDQYQIVEKRKQRLIEEVKALKPEADLDAAITAAKEAQKKWQAAGHTRRKREQQLWKEFREASDPVFAHLNEKRNEENAEQAAKIDQLRALITELEAAVELCQQQPDQAEQAGRRISDQWRQTGGSHQGLERQFQQLLNQLSQQAKQARQQQTIIQRAKIHEMHQLCCQLESAKLTDNDASDLIQQWTETSTELNPPASLSDRWKQAMTLNPNTDIADETMQQALMLCIQAEFLAGIESPSDYQQQRMDYQVNRLSQRLSGDAGLSAEEELLELETLWFGCGPLSPTDRQSVESRFKLAFEQIRQQ